MNLAGPIVPSIVPKLINERPTPLKSIDSCFLTSLRNCVLLAPDSLKNLAPFNQCTFGIQHFQGQRHWERHPDGDELVYVVDGAFDLTILFPDRRETIDIAKGCAIVVPRGLWHRAHSRGGVSVFFATPEKDMEISEAEYPLGN